MKNGGKDKSFAFIILFSVYSIHKCPALLCGITAQVCFHRYFVKNTVALFVCRVSPSVI